MSEKMSNAPVYYALAQAHFNPVAAMAKYVNDVQDSLRHQGYVLYEPQQMTHLQFTTNGATPVEPKVAQTTSWLISKSDRTCGFILTDSSLAFHTTHYQTSHEFIPELLLGINVVHDVVKLDHISRLGLRYLDALLPVPGESLEQYLVDSLHGITFGSTRRYSLNEAVFETECESLLRKSTLVARVHQFINSPLGHPPGLAPHGLIRMPRFEIKEPTHHAVLDTDHFMEGQMPLDLGKIKEALFSLHATIKLVFEAATTDHARASWR